MTSSGEEGGRHWYSVEERESRGEDRVSWRTYPEGNPHGSVVTSGGRESREISRGLDVTSRDKCVRRRG